ncbi:MAG: hypothetical protein WA021_00550 [Minisyncoccia bacterium]
MIEFPKNGNDRSDREPVEVFVAPKIVTSLPSDETNPRFPLSEGNIQPQGSTNSAGKQIDGFTRALPSTECHVELPTGLELQDNRGNTYIVEEPVTVLVTQSVTDEGKRTVQYREMRPSGVGVDMRQLQVKIQSNETNSDE